MKISATLLLLLSAGLSKCLGEDTEYTVLYQRDPSASEGGSTDRAAYAPKVSGTYNIDIAWNEVSAFTNPIPFNGPVIMAWRTYDGFADEKYTVQLKDGSTTEGHLYTSGSIIQRDASGRSPEKTSPSGIYNTWVICDDGWLGRCTGKYDEVIVDCGCPDDLPIKLDDCYIDNDNIFNSRSAYCRDYEVSSVRPVTGQWVWTGQSGPSPTISFSWGTTITDGTTSTETQAQEFGVAISAGIAVEGLSLETTMSASQSSSHATSVSSTLATSEIQTFTSDCPPLEQSSSGSWFIWQWQLDLPEDTSGNPGFTSLTQNYRCTESQFVEPQCPIGWCVGTQCQECRDEYAYLTPNAGGGTAAPPPEESGGGSCFSGASMVELESGQHVSMADLQVGEKVKIDVNNNHFEAVYGFGHREESTVADYLKIEWESHSHSHSHSPSFLEISSEHMLLVSSPGTGFRMIPASKVQVGDTLKIDGQQRIADVKSISMIKAKGLYAPLTYSGTIVVNGVQASQYISVQNTEYLVLGSIAIPFLNYHGLAHALLLPVRLIAPHVKIGTLQPFMLGLIDVAKSVLHWPTYLLLPVAGIFLLFMFVGWLVEAAILAAIGHQVVILSLMLGAALLHHQQVKLSFYVKTTKKCT